MDNVIAFPIRPRPVLVEITAAPALTPCTDARKSVFDAMRSLYWSAKAGDGAAFIALDVIATSHEFCQARRLASTLIDNLRNPPPAALVTAPCDSEQPGGVA